MNLSSEFLDFYHSWMQKVEQYDTQTLRNCFDKYFTLFVIYNRLYAEATFRLARQNIINLRNRSSFPDAQASRSYVVQYIGSDQLISELEHDQNVNDAIEKIKNLIRK